MAAYREGIKTVLIPKDNESDLYEVDEEVKKAVTFVPVTNLQQVLEKALIRPGKPKKKAAPRGRKAAPLPEEHSTSAAVRQ